MVQSKNVALIDVALKLSFLQVPSSMKRDDVNQLASRYNISQNPDLQLLVSMELSMEHGVKRNLWAHGRQWTSCKTCHACQTHYR